MWRFWVSEVLNNVLLIFRLYIISLIPFSGIQHFDISEHSFQLCVTLVMKIHKMIELDFQKNDKYEMVIKDYCKDKELREMFCIMIWRKDKE
jgi:hypothetical protein